MRNRTVLLSPQYCIGTRMDISSLLHVFLKEMNRTIVQDGEMGHFKYGFQGSGSGTNDLWVLQNFENRQIFRIGSNSVEYDIMDIYDPFPLSTDNVNIAIRIPYNEEQNFQESTVRAVISTECEQELQLALHNLAAYIRDGLQLYNDELWKKPYSDW